MRRPESILVRHGVATGACLKHLRNSQVTESTAVIHIVWGLKGMGKYRVLGWGKEITKAIIPEENKVIKRKYLIGKSYLIERRFRK